MATHYIDKNTGNIYNCETNELAQVNNICLIYPSSFYNFDDRTKPLLGKTNWIEANRKEVARDFLNIIRHEVNKENPKYNLVKGLKHKFDIITDICDRCGLERKRTAKLKFFGQFSFSGFFLST